jgi:hypothetical protein
MLESLREASPRVSARITLYITRRISCCEIVTLDVCRRNSMENEPNVALE